MSIKYNEFGEVISVNGITTGQHLGAPMQDAIAEKDSDNKAYATQVNTVTRVENCVDDAQPTAGGGSGGSGGGGGKELIITINSPDFRGDSWRTIGAEAKMSWADAKAAVLDGSLTKVYVLESPGDEYNARIHNADIRSASLDDGMSVSLCIDFMDVRHSGGSSINVSNCSIIWGEYGGMSGKAKLISSD